MRPGRCSDPAPDQRQTAPHCAVSTGACTRGPEDAQGTLAQDRRGRLHARPQPLEQLGPEVHAAAGRVYSMRCDRAAAVHERFLAMCATASLVLWRTSAGPSLRGERRGRADILREGNQQLLLASILSGVTLVWQTAHLGRGRAARPERGGLVGRVERVAPEKHSGGLLGLDM
jgi:hypothetical protein